MDRPVGVDLMAGATVANPVRLIGRAPRVAVFDSGLGGLTVFDAVRSTLPATELVYCADDAAFPYGALTDAELTARVVLVAGELIRTTQPDIVVIACNTASTLALPVLRARHELPFVGTVPAIKPAAMESRSRLISVLATPGTVRRDYTRDLVAAHAADCAVTLVGSERLAGYAEAELRGAPVPDDALCAEIAPCFVERDGKRTDAVVLACTHYPLLKGRLKALAPWPVNWIDAAPAIARRVAVLAGAVEAEPLMPPRAFFTRPGAVETPLRAALAARGLAEVDVLAVARGRAC